MWTVWNPRSPLGGTWVCGFVKPKSSVYWGDDVPTLLAWPTPDKEVMAQGMEQLVQATLALWHSVPFLSWLSQRRTNCENRDIYLFPQASQGQLRPVVCWQGAAGGHGSQCLINTLPWMNFVQSSSTNTWRGSATWYAVYQVECHRGGPCPHGAFRLLQSCCCKMLPCQSFGHPGAHELKYLLSTSGVPGIVLSSETRGCFQGTEKWGTSSREWDGESRSSRLL